MVVFHRDALVLIVSFKVVWAVGGDIQQGCDPQGIQHVSAGSMIGTAEVEKREDLHRTALHKRGKTKAPDIMSVRQPAEELGCLGSREVVFTGPGGIACGHSPSRFPLILLGLLEGAVASMGLL